MILKKIDSGVLFTSLNQFWKLLSGLVTMILIPLYLTKEAQGYWFTIMSLATLVMLADLGFSSIITQFAAHEFAYLRFDDSEITGSEQHLNRLATFFIFSTKWAFGILLVAFPIILLVGFLLLTRKDGAVKWVLPWIIYLTGAGLTFFNNSLLCFFEGCNLVGPIQKVRVIISMATFLLMWLGLVAHLGLHALSISLLLSAVFGSLILLRGFGHHMRTFYAISKKVVYSWKEKFLGLQWRYAISWASGYFIFQMYTPVMFHFYGPVEAGKVGLSIALWTAVFSISNSWIYAIIPKLNIYVSQKRWNDLDALFYKRLFFASMTFLIGALTVYLFVSFFQGRVELLNRLTDNTSLAFLGIAWFLQIIVNSLAVYLRSHKKEPMVIPSLVSAVYIVISTILCARYLPAQYFFLGYLSSYVWGLPWVVFIFVRSKKEWQADGYQIG